MELSVDSIYKQFIEHKEEFDKKRREETDKFNKELAELSLIAEGERTERIEQYKKNHADRKAREEAAKKEAQEHMQKEVRSRIKLEAELAAAEFAKQKQQEELQRLATDIRNQEFQEEQHKKAMNDAKSYKPEPAEAVQGTEGVTPETNLMSAHLRLILRQENRMGE